MSHRHGVSCLRCDFEGSGRLYGHCGDSACRDQTCAYLGHCSCLCHSGRTCECGYIWPHIDKTGV